MKRYLLATLLILSFVSYGCSNSKLQPEKQTQAIALQKKLNVTQTQAIALQEISGLGWRVNSATKQQQILAVGDRTFEILVANWSPDFSKLKFERFDVSKFFSSSMRKSNGQSSWEAVASDGSGSVFILQETSDLIFGFVFVFNSELDKHLHTIELAIDSQPHLSQLWNQDPNGKGEGFVLLKNGHILVLKEKNPALIIEFGQQGETPQGYPVGDAVGFDQRFPLPTGKVSKFVPLKFWKLEELEAKLMKDFSEITVGGDSNLYLLSDQSQRISRIEGLTPNQEEFRLAQVWNLPDKLKQAEGLLLTEERFPIVTVDEKGFGKNMFILSPLEN